MHYVKGFFVTLFSVVFLVVFRLVSIFFGRLYFRDFFTFSENQELITITWYRLGFEVFIEILLTLVSLYLLRFIRNYSQLFGILILTSPYIFFISNLVLNLTCLKFLNDIETFFVYTLIKSPCFFLCAWLCYSKKELFAGLSKFTIICYLLTIATYLIVKLFIGWVL